jgi:hypothetical protein
MEKITDPASVNNTLNPVSGGQIIPTFSFLTGHNGSQATFILRCQNCQLLTNYLAGTSQVGLSWQILYFASVPTVIYQVTLTSVVSNSFPMYINGGPLANLSLDGAWYDSFTLNTSQAVFSNYSAMLVAAGLNF